MKKQGKIARRALVTILLVAGILMASICTSMGMLARKNLINNYEAFAFSYVKAAAEYIDGDSVQKYYSTGKKDAYYQEIEKYITSTAQATYPTDNSLPDGASIKYFYVFVPENSEFTYIWDAEPGQDPEDFLAKYPFSEGAEEQVQKIVNKEVSEDSQFYNDGETGMPTLTVSVPLCNNKDEVVAIVAADLPVEDINKAVYNCVIRVIVLVVAIMLLIMQIYYYATRKMIVDPIVKLHKATDEIVENLDSDKTVKIDIHTNDEIEMLATSFENMDIKLRDYIKQNAAITAEKERIGAELALATRIQADMLPNNFPAFPERDDFDIYATMTPAKEVGGDFYDFFLVDDMHLAMVMADVSGKGVPAALFMMMSKILIQNAVLSGKSPAEALEAVNNQICANNREEMFVTVWLGIVDFESGLLTAANAGHEKPIIKAPDGDFEFFRDRHGFVIGGIDGLTYRNYEIRLQKGAKLFIYTDGVMESTNEEDALYGVERTLQALNDVKDQKPQEILKHVKNSVDAFVGSAPQFDDLTMLCFEYIGFQNEMTFDATLENVEKAVAFVSKQAEKLPFSSKDKYQLEVAVDEIVSNIARYAYEEKTGKATIHVDVDCDDGLTVTVTDSGIPYNPLEKEDPDITLSAEERGIGGYGIFLVKKMMDDIAYERKGESNILTMRKRISNQ